MITRGDNYQERQMRAAVQAVAAELVNGGLNVVDVNVDRKPLFPGGRLFTSGHITLQDHDRRVIIELASPDGVAVVYAPGVYAMNKGRVVERRIKVIVVDAVKSLIVDYSGP